MVETLVGTAMGTTEHDLQQLARIVGGLFAERGWVPPPEDPEAEGEPLRVRFQDHPGRGRWVFVERQPVSQLPLARELAARLGAALTVHEIVAREEVVRRADGELGFVCQARSLRVRADGRLEPLGGELGREELRTAHGDLSQTASHLLRVLVNRAAAAQADGLVLDLFLPAGRRADSLTPRLTDLATQIALAGGYALETLDGRRMLRLVLPDGARRLAMVTDQDLEVLERVTGFTSPDAPARPTVTQAPAARTMPIPRITTRPAPKAPAPKKPAPKKPAPKKPAPKRPAPKRPAPKKPAPKRPAPKKPAPKKPAPKKPAPKRR